MRQANIPTIHKRSTQMLFGATAATMAVVSFISGISGLVLDPELGLLASIINIAAGAGFAFIAHHFFRAHQKTQADEAEEQLLMETPAQPFGMVDAIQAARRAEFKVQTANDVLHRAINISHQMGVAILHQKSTTYDALKAELRVALHNTSVASDKGNGCEKLLLGGLFATNTELQIGRFPGQCIPVNIVNELAGIASIMDCLEVHSSLATPEQVHNMTNNMVYSLSDAIRGLKQPLTRVQMTVENLETLEGIRDH